MRKSQTTTFSLLLFYIGKFIFCQKTYSEKLHLHYRFFTWQVIKNTVTPKTMQILIVFVDTIIRSKILGNRLGILTQNLIAMDYFFYLYLSDKYLQYRKKSILIWAMNFIIKSIREGIEILVKRFFFHFPSQHLT